MNFNQMYGGGYPSYGYIQPQQQFNNPYQSVMAQQQPTQNTIPMTSPTTPQSTFGQNNIPMIAGKIVESVEMSKVQEVTPGGYGVFPLTDFSKVVIKAYDKEGNLQYLTYDLVKPEETIKEDVYVNKLTDIYDYLGKLDKKIDSIKVGGTSTPTTRKKKVVEEVDDYE